MRGQLSLQLQQSELWGKVDRKYLWKSTWSSWECRGWKPAAKHSGPQAGLKVHHKTMIVKTPFEAGLNMGSTLQTTYCTPMPSWKVIVSRCKVQACKIQGDTKIRMFRMNSEVSVLTSTLAWLVFTLDPLHPHKMLLWWQYQLTGEAANDLWLPCGFTLREKQKYDKKVKG